jgi:hypothetical protein
MTVRKNGADAGTLKTRMDVLIRDQEASWHGHIGGANWLFVMRGLDPRIHPSSKEFCEEDGLPGQARQ